MSEPLIAPKRTAHGAERHQQMVEKVRRLIALSTSSNPHEAAAAAAKAAELMHAYTIEQFELDRAQSQHENLIRDGWYNAEPDQIRWQFSLLGTIAKVNFCRTLLYRSSPPRYRVFGQVHAIEITMYVFDYLVGQIDIYEEADLALWRHKSKRATPPIRLTTGDMNRFRASFRVGCATIIEHRLEEAFDELNRAAAQSTALIIYNDKAIADYITTEVGRVGSYTPSRQSHNMDGYSAGQRRGAEIDLNRHGIETTHGPSHSINAPALRVTERSSL